MKIQIKSRYDENKVLFEADCPDLKTCVEQAVKSGATLSGADLFGANLSGATLSRADLFRADLFRANLSGATLFRANLSGATLSGANLTRADLTRAVHNWAQVAWKGHGECGRMLTAVQLKKDDKIMFFCGCFTGSEEELREYIRSGKETYAASRTKALHVLLDILTSDGELELAPQPGVNV